MTEYTILCTTNIGTTSTAYERAASPEQAIAQVKARHAKSAMARKYKFTYTVKG